MLAARWIDKRPLADYGLRLDHAWWTSLGGGFALGALLMTLVFAVEWAAGWIAIVGTGFSLSLMSFTVVKVLCVGVYEEVVARGYLLRNIGVIGSSLVFAALHAFNDNAASLLGIAILLAGHVSSRA